MDDSIVSITGLGNVGAELASLWLANHDNLRLNIMEPNSRLSGRILDLQHASFVKNNKVFINQEQLFLNSDLIIHTAGGKVALGEDRNSVIRNSLKIARQIFQKKKFVKNPYIIVVANPVDVIAYAIHQFKVTDDQKIISTGTWIDTIRLKYYFKKYHIPYDANLMVIGEHGTGITIISNQVHHPDYSKAVSDMLSAATTIKKYEGATKYAIANVAYTIAKSIINKQNLKAPVSILLSDENAAILGVQPLFLSIPVEIKNGTIIQRKLTEIMGPEEIKSLKNNAQKIKKLLQSQQF